MPACTIIAAALAVLTKQSKICVFGTPISLTYPHRLAEEYAMLDVMSGGRLECAFPLGTGMEYWVNPINPVFARERFRESMDILMQAWTRPGPTTYDGEFYQYKYLNPFPTPYQKPHPKIYMVGSGTEDTIQYAAEKGFGYSQVFTPVAQQLKSFANYRRISTQHGHEHDSESIIISAMVYVAETEAKAIDEGRDHILFYFQKLLKTTPEINSTIACASGRQGNPIVGRMPPGAVFEHNDMHSRRVTPTFRPCKLVRGSGQSQGIVGSHLN
jgi:alkanesulfonate monooxygenase SsuD/methylene tetrahydromethanopterin reductase-like flavin-dependent oxidoreductase (luciferase family)